MTVLEVRAATTAAEEQFWSTQYRLEDARADLVATRDYWRWLCGLPPSNRIKNLLVDVSARLSVLKTSVSGLERLRDEAHRQLPRHH
jgi:hypothetical protein